MAAGLFGLAMQWAVASRSAAPPRPAGTADQGITERTPSPTTAAVRACVTVSRSRGTGGASARYEY